MSLQLPTPPKAYNQKYETERDRSLQIADRRNRKIGEDVDIGDEKLVIKSPNGSRWVIEVSDTGVVSATPHT